MICNNHSISIRDTGFTKKDARFSNFKSISNLVSDDKESGIIENNVGFKCFSNGASFIDNPGDSVMAKFQE